MDWEERYVRFGRPFGEHPHVFVEQMMTQGGFADGLGDCSRVLCPGDGYGRQGIALAQRGHRVLGLDLSPTATADARARAEQAGATYAAVTADLSRPPYPLDADAVFDAVVSVWFRLPERTARMDWNQEAVRHLRRRGRILFVGGRRVTSATAEIEEWPEGIAWADHSTAEEVRLLGQLLE